MMESKASSMLLKRVFCVKLKVHTQDWKQNVLLVETNKQGGMLV